MHDILYVCFPVLICGFVLGLIGRKGWLSVSVLTVMIFSYFTAGISRFVSTRIFGRSFIISLLENFNFNVVGFEIRWGTTVDFLVWMLLLGLIVRPLFRKWELGSAKEREVIFAKRAFVPMLILAVPLVVLLFRF